MELIFDVVICVGHNDESIIKNVLSYNKINIIGFRNIYLVCANPSIKIEGTITIDENIFPFNKNDLIQMFGNSSRIGWYLQQLLKIYSGNIIPGISKRYLVVDADTYFLKPTKFITDDGKHIFTTGTEYHIPYFIHMNKLHNSLKKNTNLSGIAHHMFFHNDRVNDLIKLIEDNFLNIKPFWKLFLESIDINNFSGSGASEYEIYFNYMYQQHNNDIIISQLKWENVNNLNNLNDNDFVSMHWHSRN
jgi:hypothetical protein